MPSGKGQCNPASSARRKYSRTVARPMEQLLATWRSLRPQASFSRKTSLMVRMDNLFPDISASSSPIIGGAEYLVLSRVATALKGVAGMAWNQWPVCSGMGGRNAVESVARMAWNRWPEWSGIRRQDRCPVFLPVGGVPSISISYGFSPVPVIGYHTSSRRG